MAAKTAAQSIIPIRMAWRAFTTLERKGLVIMGGKCARLGTGLEAHRRHAGAGAPSQAFLASAFHFSLALGSRG